MSKCYIDKQFLFSMTIDSLIQIKSIEYSHTIANNITLMVTLA